MVPMRTLAVALFVLGAECFAPRDLFRVLHKPRSASALTVSMKVKISRGDVLTGRVTAVKPFGAFVEVGGTSGLLHISQISADFVEDLSQTLTVGMSIKCMIMDDKRKGRVSLSIKTLEPEPGDMLVDPQRVFDLAEETAVRYQKRVTAQQRAKQAAPKPKASPPKDLVVLADGFCDDDGLCEIFDLDTLDSLLLDAEHAESNDGASRHGRADPRIDPTRPGGVPDPAADADEIFAALDTNGDGEISLDELRAHMLTCGATETAIEAVFGALDTNADEAVSRAEFSAAFLKNPSLRVAPGLGAYNSKMVEEIEADADAIFAQMDVDGNGGVDRDELRDQLRRRAEFSDAAVGRIFAALDANDDGVVSRDELRGAFVRCSALRAATGGNWAGGSSGELFGTWLY